jgi:threonine dehydrogenase-like Zn-dependent dehydrogenase
MTATGLAVSFTGVRRPFVLKEFPVPEPAPGAVLVKIIMANVCGSDLHIWRGEYDLSRGEPEPYSRAIGHEMTGSVYKLGEGVTTDSAGIPLAVGDRVVYRYFMPCGNCRACLRHSTPRCLRGLRHRHPPEVFPHFNAAYGQFFYLPSGCTIYKVPDSVSDDMAGPANCALAQVIYGLEIAGTRLGDHVVVQGCGGLGINAIAVAREMGAQKVIAIDAIDDRLQLARDFGADDVIDLRSYATSEDRVKRVKELTDGWGADIVVEVAGHPRVVNEGIAMLGQGGKYVEIGNINQRLTFEFDPSTIVHGGKTILGVMWYEPDSLLKALNLLASRQDRYPFHRVLSHKYPLTAINEAFQDQDNGKVHRAALLPWA